MAPGLHAPALQHGRAGVCSAGQGRTLPARQDARPPPPPPPAPAPHHTHTAIHLYQSSSASVSRRLIRPRGASLQHAHPNTPLGSSPGKRTRLHALRHMLAGAGGEASTCCARTHSRHIQRHKRSLLPEDGRNRGCAVLDQNALWQASGLQGAGRGAAVRQEGRGAAAARSNPETCNDLVYDVSRFSARPAAAHTWNFAM
jgi:hypothetical protein